MSPISQVDLCDLWRKLPYAATIYGDSMSPTGHIELLHRAKQNMLSRPMRTRTRQWATQIPAPYGELMSPISTWIPAPNEMLPSREINVAKESYGSPTEFIVAAGGGFDVTIEPRGSPRPTLPSTGRLAASVDIITASQQFTDEFIKTGNVISSACRWFYHMLCTFAVSEQSQH